METSPRRSRMREWRHTGKPRGRRRGEQSAFQGNRGTRGEEQRRNKQGGGEVQREPDGLGWWGPKAQSPQFVNCGEDVR
jgi:hypothetical protein